MMRWIVVGTVLQVAMVVVGHWATPVAQLFAPLGMGISFAAGLLWVRSAAPALLRQAFVGGAVVGGACAAIGIAVSLALGDVTAVILLFGTASSAVAGGVGGALGRRTSAQTVAAS